MKTFKFLHCADIHLDMPFSSLGVENGLSALRRQELKKTFESIIAAAKNENVDMLLISGDLYEHSYVNKATVSFINDCFKRLGSIKVLLLPGNHDPLTVNSYYSSFPWNENVFILSDKNPYYFFKDIDVCIYGAGFNGNTSGEAQMLGVRPLEDTGFNVLMLHGTVDMIEDQKNYNAVRSNELALLGMDYVALGHSHKRTDAAGGYENICNPGSPEPMGFDEEGTHGVFMCKLTLSDNTEKLLEKSFLELGTRKYINKDVDISGCCSEHHAAEQIFDAVKQCGVEKNLFCISLRGYVDRDVKLDMDYLKSLLKPRIFYVKLKNETMPDFDFDQLVKEPGLRGLYVRKILRLLDETQDQYKKKLIREALYYGMEAIEKGKVDVG